MKKQIKLTILSLLLASIAEASTVSSSQYTQKTFTVDEGKGPKTVRIIEYSGPDKLSEADLTAMTKRMEEQQAQMNKMVTHMMRSFQEDPFLHAGFPSWMMGPPPQHATLSNTSTEKDKSSTTAKQSWWQKGKLENKNN